MYIHRYKNFHSITLYMLFGILCFELDNKSQHLPNSTQTCETCDFMATAEPRLA